jgi:hypothetical protein
MKKLHYCSAFILSIFIAVHLMNHIGSLWGAETHVQMMAALRPFYRHPTSESVLFFCLSVQLISGFNLLRYGLSKKADIFERLQRYSGLYIAFFLLIHISAVLVGRHFLQLDTNFYFGVAGINTFPYALFFIPYYFFAVNAIFIHLGAAHYRKTTFNGISPQLQFYLILTVGFLTSCFLFYGFTDQFKGVVVPKEYLKILP